MQGGVLGSLCFLSFLLSLGDAQSSEDLITRFNPEENSMESEIEIKEENKESDEAFTFNTEDADSDERSLYSSHSGSDHALDFNNYANLQGSNAYPFGFHNPGYNLGSNYGEGETVSYSQAISSGGSNYASSEAGANAQALADLNSYSSPFTSEYFGSPQRIPQPTGTQFNQNPITWNSFNPNSIPFSSSSHAQIQSGMPAHISSSGLGSSFSSLESDELAHVIGSGWNYGGHSSQLVPESQVLAFSPGLSTAHASAESGINSQANAYVLQETGSPFGSGYFDSGFPVDSQVPFGSNFASSEAIVHSFPEEYSLFGPNFGSSHAQVQSLTNQSMIQVHAQASGQSGFATAAAFAGVQSRTIPDDEYIIPRIPDGETILSCSKSGELHNVWSAEYDCLICACVSQYGRLSPVCVRCDLCVVPIMITPDVPVPPVKIVPEIVPVPQVSCDPLPTNTPFQNPLNPCQICICQHSFGLEQDVRITCEETASCVIPDSMIVPPTMEIATPPPLPTCEEFPSNVVFPHPYDICQNCECIESYASHIPKYKIVCFPTPGCESLHRPSPRPELGPDSTTLIPIEPGPQLIPLPSPSPVPDPGLLPWPPSPHLPPGPLPGPPPHKSCAPYPPNQQFQHPWDDCQICICSEIYSIGVVNIEVNCFTNPACCRDYGALQSWPAQIGEPGPIPDTVIVTGLVPTPQFVEKPSAGYLSRPVPYAVPDLTDNVCDSRKIGEEFIYSQCKICNCQIYGTVVVPVCRRVNKAECVVLPAAVPVGNIVYIEPRCRYRLPVDPFTQGCSSCMCQSVFNYVVAKCHPIPGCGKSQYPGRGIKAEASALANAQTGSSYGNQYGFGGSQSLSDVNAAALLGSSSSSAGFGYPFHSGSSFADATAAQSGFEGSQLSSDLNSAAFLGSSSLGLGYPFNSGSSFADASAIQSGFGSSHSSSDLNALLGSPTSSAGFGYPFHSGSSFADASAAQAGFGGFQSSDFNAASSSGSLSSGFGYPFQSGSSFADASAVQSGFESSHSSSDLNAAALSSSGFGYSYLPPGSHFTETPAQSGSTLYSKPLSNAYVYSGDHALSDTQSLYQSLYGKPYAISPVYQSGLLQSQNAAMADYGMGVLGHNYGSGFGRPHTRSGDVEDHDVRKR